MTVSDVLRKACAMQYTEIFFFSVKKKKMKISSEKEKKNDFFLIFAQNIDCGYTLEPPLCFGTKIRKIGIPLHIPVLLYKSGVQGGIHYKNMSS